MIYIGRMPAFPISSSNAGRDAAISSSLHRMYVCSLRYRALQSPSTSAIHRIRAFHQKHSMRSQPPTPIVGTPAARPPKKDWFGYIFTTAAGVVATVLVAWYQLYVTQRDAAAAEIERARAVRQVAVAIVEEHVLNGKKLELERLARLIDQRRRDESITLPIPVTEVVELAEFSISSSRHLSVDRKEEMKPLFDAFYAEQRARSFQPSDGQVPSTPLLNEVAKRIQEGRGPEALAALKRLDEVQRKELAEASRKAKPSIFDAVLDVFSSPTKTAILFGFIALYFFIVSALERRMRALRARREFSRPL